MALKISKRASAQMLGAVEASHRALATCLVYGYADHDQPPSSAAVFAALVDALAGRHCQDTEVLLAAVPACGPPRLVRRELRLEFRGRSLVAGQPRRWEVIDAHGAVMMHGPTYPGWWPPTEGPDGEDYCPSLSMALGQP